MPNSIFGHATRATLIAVLSVLFITSCAKKTKPDNADGTAGGGQDQAATENPGAVTDKDMSYDAKGSDSGKIDGLNTIHFAYDKAALTSEAKSKLSENAKWIKSNGNVTVQIEGHTDERGSAEYNLALGERRAKSVQSYLESLGVPKGRMSIISYGEEKPIARGDNEQAWAQNRRANFVPIAK